MDIVYAPEGAFAAVPALDAVGLAVLAIVLVLGGAWSQLRLPSECQHVR
jgi:hypothetical protein